MSLDKTNRLSSIEGKSGAVIRLQEVIVLLGVSRMTLHRWVKAGRFPQPLKANGRTFGFNYNSVIEWMNCLEGKNNATGDKNTELCANSVKILKNTKVI